MFNNILSGEIKISGSKNATLPILAASILSEKKIDLKRVPIVKDVVTMCHLLKYMGSNIKINSQKKIYEVTNRVYYIQTFYNLYNAHTHTHPFLLSFIQSSLVVQLILLLPSFSTQMINAHALLLFPLFHLIAHSLLQDHIKLEPIPYVMIWKHY